MFGKRFAPLALMSALAFAPAAQAQTEIQWWHAMSGPLGEWVNDQARQFNESQKVYKVMPTYEGTYDEAMTAAVAAFRAGDVPMPSAGVRIGLGFSAGAVHWFDPASAQRIVPA